MRHRVVLTIILALIVSAALIAPTPAHAVQARVTLNCGSDVSFPSSSTFYGSGLTSTNSVNLATVEQSGTASDGIYVASSSCKFKIVGTVQFTADASKVGQLILNNLSIRNVGTAAGTATIRYRHQSGATNPAIAQCVSLSADGFFYAGSTFPSGDGFDLTETVEYFKGSNVWQRYILGRGRTLVGGASDPTDPNATIGSCPYTSGYQTKTTPVGVLSFDVTNDAFFNPQNPAQIFNRIPACSDCNSAGSTSTSGGRITKTFGVDLAPNHEVSSIATLRGGIAQQAENDRRSGLPLPGEPEREAAANALLQRIAIGDWASIDFKPGQSVNYVNLTTDQGNNTVDLHGACADPQDPTAPFFDITQVDAGGLTLFAGTSGLQDGATGPTFYEPGATIVRWVYGDFNMDGCTDLRGQWSQSDMTISPGDDRVQLRGNIYVNGQWQPFSAEDSLVTLQ